MTQGTQRDRYIQAKALVRSITKIQNQPNGAEEHSEMLAMCRILRSIIEPSDLARLVMQETTEGSIDLQFPDASERTMDDALYIQEFQTTCNRISDEMFDAYRPVACTSAVVISAKQFAEQVRRRAQCRTKH